MLDKTGIKYTQLSSYRENCTNLRIKECEERADEHRRKKPPEEKRALEWERFVKVEREREHPDIIPLYMYPKRKDCEVPAVPVGTRLTDDDYYMGVACLSAKRSKDPVTTVC